MAGKAVAVAAPGETADRRITRCLAEGRSFILNTGAGVGKTYSLVEDLRKLCTPAVTDRLKRDRRQITCITCTNVARDQVTDHIQDNFLVHVLTTHDFLWSALQPRQQALRRTLLDFDVTFPTGSLRRVDQAELTARVTVRLEMKYSNRDSRFLEGWICHNDLPSIVYTAYTRYDKLARIMASRHPYIFINEYQDTSKAVIDILLYRMLPLADNKLVLGLFDDKMQSICHHGERKGIGELPVELTAPSGIIVKRENRRCSPCVINVLNNVQTGVMQIPGSNNAQSDVAYIRIAAGADGAGLQRARDLLTDTLSWDPMNQGTHEFYLTHRLIVRRTGFVDLLQAFTDCGSFVKNTFTDSLGRRIALLLEEVELLALVWEKGQISETLDRLHDAGYRLTSRTTKSGVHDALNALTAKRAVGTVRGVFETIRDHQLLPLTNDLALQLVSTQPILTAEMDDTTREHEQLETTLYGAFFVLPYQQVIAFARFSMTSMSFATKHSVRGDELDTILVILGDSGAAWTFYSFDKYLSGVDEAAKPERAKRSRNAFYVCCSRARQGLAVVDPTDISAAKDG